GVASARFPGRTHAAAEGGGTGMGQGRGAPPRFGRLRGVVQDLAVMMAVLGVSGGTSMDTLPYTKEFVSLGLPGAELCINAIDECVAQDRKDAESRPTKRIEPAPTAS